MPHNTPFPIVDGPDWCLDDILRNHIELAPIYFRTDAHMEALARRAAGTDEALYEKIRQFQKENFHIDGNGFTWSGPSIPGEGVGNRRLIYSRLLSAGGQITSAPGYRDKAGAWRPDPICKRCDWAPPCRCRVGIFNHDAQTWLADQPFQRVSLTLPGGFYVDFYVGAEIAGASTPPTVCEFSSTRLVAQVIRGLGQSEPFQALSRPS